MIKSLEMTPGVGTGEIYTIAFVGNKVDCGCYCKLNLNILEQFCLEIMSLPKSMPSYRFPPIERY